MILKENMDNLDLILLLQENNPDKVAEVLKRVNDYEDLKRRLNPPMQKLGDISDEEIANSRH